MKYFASILLVVLMSGTIRAKDYSTCFVPGETIEYKIKWMGIPIAWSKTTTESISENGRELIRIRMVSQTYKSYKHIFEVDDATEVVIDPETALPLRHDWVINEGSIHKSHLTTFHHDKKVAVFQDRISKDIREIPIESDTREVLSFIYANRNEDLATLTAQKHKLLVTGKVYELDLKITQRDNIKLPEYGKIASVELEPQADFDGIFLRQGKVFFWVSKQNLRVVTCIEAKVAVGKITIKLQQVSGPGNGFWSKKQPMEHTWTE